MLSRLLQNLKLRRQVQREQQRFHRRQELHLRVFIATFTSCQNAACSHKFFPLLGGHFHWANVISAACFTLRGHSTHRFTAVFVFGQQELPSAERAFSLTSFEAWSFLLRLNKGLSFLQSAFWIWITKRFSLVREWNVFLQCCITLDPAS